MSEHHERYLELCAADVLGALDPLDRSLLEEHLRVGCPECEAALGELSSAVVLLAASAPPALPSPALRGRIVSSASAVGSGDAQRGSPVVLLPGRRFGRLLSWTPAALAAGLTVAAITGWSTASDLRSRLGASRERLAQLEQHLAQTRQRLQDEQMWSAALTSFDTSIVPLQPTPDGTIELRARAIYDPTQGRAVLLVENLRAPAGRDYQLWALRGAQPQSLGLIRTDARGYAVLRLEKLGGSDALSAFAISLEPVGGAPTPDRPTGPVVMLGTVRA